MVTCSGFWFQFSNGLAASWKASTLVIYVRDVDCTDHVVLVDVVKQAIFRIQSQQLLVNVRDTNNIAILAEYQCFTSFRD